jgi:hypothetical protein
VGFNQASIAKIRAFASAHTFAIEYDPLAPAGAFLAAIRDDRNVPATDDRPFFFAADLGERQVPAAYAILFVALVPAVLLSYLLLIRPLRRAIGPALGTGIGAATTLRSLAVGLGFIGAEIVLLQRLTLYLGQPAFALSLGLAALLIGAAIGSSWSSRLFMPEDPDRAAAVCAVAVPVLLVVLTWIAALTLASPLLVRGAVAVIASAGLGIPLGAVFPKIVAQAGAADPRLVSWAWAINGAASVVGSILAVALTINIGFTAVGIVAAACYLVPMIIGRAQRVRRGSERLSERAPVAT